MSKSKDWTKSTIRYEPTCLQILKTGGLEAGKELSRPINRIADALRAIVKCEDAEEHAASTLRETGVTAPCGEQV